MSVTQTPPDEACIRLAEVVRSPEAADKLKLFRIQRHDLDVGCRIAELSMTSYRTRRIRESRPEIDRR